MKNEVLHIREDIVLFFLLILLFSLPLWVAEHFIHVSALPDNLPITDVVATFVPMLSGFILYRSRNRGVGSEFIKKAVDFGKIRKPEWMILLVLMMPLLFLITYLLMQIFGIDFPDNYRIPVVTPLLFIGYLIAAAGEEMGYMGYAMNRLLRVADPLKAGFVIGVFWAFWHLPSMIQLEQPPVLIIWGLMATIAIRVIYTWLFIKINQSVFGIILVHAIFNTSRSIFPGGRGYFEKYNGIVGYTLIILFCILILLLWKKREAGNDDVKSMQHRRSLLI